MSSKILLDTNIVVFRVSNRKKLSRDQLRVLDQADAEGREVAISGMTLAELAFIDGSKNLRNQHSAKDILLFIGNYPGLTVLPITIEIAREAAALRPILIEPRNCIIAATARVHGLRLLTTDQRIIAANVVSTIE